MIASAEDGMNAVEAGKCSSTGAGIALVTGFGDVIEVVTTRSLQQVAAGGGLVPQLCARTREQRAAEHAVAPSHLRVGREIAVANQRADPQAAVGGFFDLVERQSVDIDQLRWRLDLQLHKVEQIGAASNDLGARLDGRGGSLRG